jgi:uncharacterized protein (TIGR02996 family)
VLRYEKAGAVWTIEQAGAQITTTLDGVASIESFESELIARKRLDILAGKQTRDGWKRIKDQVVTAPRPKRAQAEARVEDARNLELEAAILADPTSAEPYRMYADWLEQQGDPRGQLIALELAEEERSNDKKLELMRSAYAHRIWDYAYKGVVNEVGCRATLARGYVAELCYVEGELAPKLRTTLAAPAARFVLKIQLDDDGQGKLVEALPVIADAPMSLRELVIGGATSLASIDPIARVLPRLHRFALLSVHERQLRVAPLALAQIATSSFPVLERLHLDVPPEMARYIEPLFERTDLPNLIELSLRSSADAALVAMLADGPLAGQIKTLALEAYDHADRAILDAALRKLPKLATLTLPPAMFDDDDVAIYEKRGIALDSLYEPERYPALSTTIAGDDDDAFDDVRE